MTTREQVWAALLNQLQAGTTTNGQTLFKTYTRRKTLPALVPASQCPQLQLWDADETEIAHYAVPPKRDWKAQIVIVFYNPTQNPTQAVAGATILNPYLDAIETALNMNDPDPLNQTLGGLVHWCRIDGTIFKEDGDTDPNGLGGAVIPITISVP